MCNLLFLSSHLYWAYLRYEYYYALVRDFPDLRFTINGGITSVSEVTILDVRE